MKYQNPITTTCLKVVCDERCRDEIKTDFRKKVGQFIKVNVTQYAPAMLQQFESQMSAEEKEEMAKMMQ